HTVTHRYEPSCIVTHRDTSLCTVVHSHVAYVLAFQNCTLEPLSTSIACHRIDSVNTHILAPRARSLQSLPDKGTDVNALSREYDNVLHAALAEGHERIVELLLGKGANVNAQGGYYGNAPQAASAEGHKQIVKKLLDQGANF